MVGVMESRWTFPIGVFVTATCVKILLIPSYKSTDFEVHRNWLAITHTLPLSKWYYEATSEWTLDYPPFFAWFEFLLSQLAALVDPLIVQLDNLGYSGPSCILFQRMSVIATDLTLLYAIIEYDKVKGHKLPTIRPSSTVTVLLLLNFGLLVVDHIHFQYNGMLFGLLLLSIVRLIQGRCLEGAFWFACLLNFKHIFAYVAPAYFVFLLKHYCFKHRDPEGHVKQPSDVLSAPSLLNFDVRRFIKLGVLVISIFLLSFGPFIYMGQLDQVISRLFPFKRGLCHAYWAPNIWALYSLADKVLSVFGTTFGISVSSGGSMTSGLVGEMSFQALPSISPVFTLLLTVAAMLPVLLKLWIKPSAPLDFVKALIVCAYSSFLFGWHVHEKAIMMVTLPTCLLAVEKRFFARLFILLSIAGHVSLFPLLYKPAETPIKVSLFILCALLNVLVLQRHFRFYSYFGGKKLKIALKNHLAPENEPQLSKLEQAYVICLMGTQVYCLFLHGLFPFTKKLQFLPLLLTSVSCAAGIVWTWMQFYFHVLFD